ncbi:NAD(P)-binding domain-containing protein [Luteimicrobium sp. DT211]|uniref:NAD(P)-binding domain-containing protein n=1 Tax=Luteimicrobium sp. DT211 TaxID=3393412 RepID=UPI003CF94ACE
MDAEVAVIGAGPYGLSTAAHLIHRGVETRIFGDPMVTWREHMPAGMLLKSDGFASSLDAPTGGWRLADYAARTGIPYGDRTPRVSLENFVQYGLAFQGALVPGLDTRSVSSLEGAGEGFALTLADGTELTAHRVVVAAGITHFAWVPDQLGALGGCVSHSSQHRRFDQFEGRRVAVVGAGSSAVEIAASLIDVGSQVDLVTRRPDIPFWGADDGRPRTVRQRVQNPSTGLGPGWRQKFCEDLPDAFRRLSPERRLGIVRNFLGPVSGAWMKDKVLGGANLVTGVDLAGVELIGEEAVLQLKSHHGDDTQKRVDHVIAATGYRADLDRLPFLADDLRAVTRRVGTMPELSRYFESSVPGLYYVGNAAAGSFGPLMRFMVGAEFAAPRVASHVSRAVGRAPIG